jgi:uncharacterized protein (TIGR02001 family)
MKRWTIIVLVAAVSTTAATPLAGQVALSVGADPVSHYVWRGIDMFDGGTPIQPWITLDFGDTGLSVGAWGSFSTVKRGHLVGGAIPRSDLDELDLFASFARDAGPLSFEVGGIHYSFFADGYPNEATTTYEAYGAVGLNAVPFAPTVTAYYDFNLGDGVYLTVTGEQPITVGIPLDLSFGIGYMDQAYRPAAGISDVNLGLGVPLTVGPLSIVPSLRYTYAPKSGPLESNSIVWGMVGISATQLLGR